MHNTQCDRGQFRNRDRKSSKYPYKLKKRTRRGKKLLPEPKKNFKPESLETLELGSALEAMLHFPDLRFLCGDPPFEDERREVRVFEARVINTVDRLIQLHG